MKTYIETIRRVTLVVGVACLFGCQGLSQVETKQSQDPNELSNRILERYLEHVEQGQYCMPDLSDWDDPVDCDGLRKQVVQLYAAHPEHERSAFLVALLYWHAGKTIQAGNLLDSVIARHQSRPEAVAIRAQLAIEEGNLNYAKKILENQIQLTPRFHQLYETLSAAHYVGNDLELAGRLLLMAKALGAPVWRVAYHQGLIHEKQNNVAAACRAYDLAHRNNPAFGLAEGRLIWLAQIPGCTGEFVEIGGGEL